MIDLAPRSAAEGLGLPLRIGAAELHDMGPLDMASIAPFRDREAAVTTALRAALGTGLSPVGRWLDLGGGGRIFWSGLGQWHLAGPQSRAPLGTLDGIAAVTEQGDGWCGLTLTGAAAAEVLARLVPLDLHAQAFEPGKVARTLLGHMTCVLIATDAGFDVLTMRSVAGTAVHEIAVAMRAVAAIAAAARGA